MFKGEGKKNVENPDKLNRLSEDTQLTGNITTKNSMRIDGIIHGNIECGSKLVLGEKGIIEGNITAVDVEVNGKIKGDIIAKEVLVLHKTAVILGNIAVNRIIIEDGAQIEGNVKTSPEIIHSSHQKPQKRSDSEVTSA